MEDNFNKYCFVTDDDGHSYLIPVAMRSQLIEWLYREDSKPIDKFDEYLVSGSLEGWTFENPRQDIDEY